MLLEDFRVRSIAVEIVRRLQKAGFEAYWVGGCVRDMLLGSEPYDYDVAASARPEQVEKLFARTVPVGRKFGVLLVIEQGRQFQVATFRAETEYRDGRRPSLVTFTDAVTDARRRDFTINGLFYDPVRNFLHDWVGGETDVRKRIVRAIGRPHERFAEDHLRLLRAVRFAAELSFEIEPVTFEAIQANAPEIRTVSAERVREELLRLFQPPHAARGMELLRKSGLLSQVLPEVAATVDCEQSPEFHPEGSVYNHVVRILEQLPPDASTSLVWAAMLHDIAKPETASRDPVTGQVHFYGHEKVGAGMAGEILRRLKFPRKEVEVIVTSVRHHMQFKDATSMRKATLRRLLMRPTFPLELELHRLDCLGSNGRLDHYLFFERRSGTARTTTGNTSAVDFGKGFVGIGNEAGTGDGQVAEGSSGKTIAG